MPPISFLFAVGVTATQDLSLSSMPMFDEYVTPTLSHGTFPMTLTALPDPGTLEAVRWGNVAAYTIRFLRRLQSNGCAGHAEWHLPGKKFSIDTCVPYMQARPEPHCQSLIRHPIVVEFRA